MSENIEAGSAVLAKKLKINCIKINFAQRPRIINGNFVYPYNIERGGIVIITSEIPIEDRPKQFLNEKYLYFQEDDSINGSKLWCYTDKPNKKAKRDIGTLEVRSGRHSRQELEVEGERCYAVIITSWNKEKYYFSPFRLFKTEYS